MKFLGIIPARSGSKGIPNKNIKLLNGKPLIAYTIEKAIKVSHLNNLIVSTDSLKIKEVSEEYGANVPFLRPSRLAMDNTPSIDVVIHALNYFECQNIQFDAVCLLQPTSPFRKEEFIDKCIRTFKNSNADSLISVLEMPHIHNPHWAFETDKKGFLKISTGDKDLISRRQELPKAYFRDGSIYLSRVEYLKKEKKLVGGKIKYCVNNPDLYCNLDNKDDWEKAKIILKENYQKFQNKHNL